jgi:hypothetical protein
VVGAARDAVAVAVVGVGAGEQIGLGDRGEQAHADHGRGDARGDLEALGERTEGGGLDAVGRDAQAVGLAVGEGAGALDVVDARGALGGDLVDRVGLELVAVDAGRERAAVGVAAGDGEAQEEADERSPGPGARPRPSLK